MKTKRGVYYYLLIGLACWFFISKMNPTSIWRLLVLLLLCVVIFVIIRLIIDTVCNRGESWLFVSIPLIKKWLKELDWSSFVIKFMCILLLAFVCCFEKKLLLRGETEVLFYLFWFMTIITGFMIIISLIVLPIIKFFYPVDENKLLPFPEKIEEKKCGPDTIFLKVCVQIASWSILIGIVGSIFISFVSYSAGGLFLLCAFMGTLLILVYIDLRYLGIDFFKNEIVAYRKMYPDEEEDSCLDGQENS